MKTKLIQTEVYLLLVSEVLNLADSSYVYNSLSGLGVYLHDEEFGDGLIVMYHSQKQEVCEDRKNITSVLGYYTLTKEAKELDLPQLPSFNSVDVRDLALDFVDPHENVYGQVNAFEAGYKAAQSSNKQYSLEDMKKAIAMAKEGKLSFKFDNEGIVYKHTQEEIIHSLSTQQLPKEFECSYVKYCSTGRKCDNKGNNCDEAILKLKTITNARGKQEIQGKFIW